MIKYYNSISAFYALSRGFLIKKRGRRSVPMEQNNEQGRLTAKLRMRWRNEWRIVVGHTCVTHVASCGQTFTETGDREISGVTPLASEIFQVNYKERSDQAAERFAEWLEDVLVRGLEVWRQGI